MRIKLRHLEVFNALIEAGSVSRAAARLGLSQPAVSIALGNLEEALGFRLFHRDRGFFAPTSEATLLHDEVTRGLMALARFEQRAEEIRTGITGGVSIATNGALAFNFLPGVVAAFQHAFPETRVEMRVHSSRRIASWVGSRQIDLGFIDAPVPVAGLAAETFRMECVCILREDDPLAAEQVIRPQSLDGRAVIAVTGDHNVDRQLEQLMSDAGSVLRYTASSYYFAIARNMVAAGDAVSIIDPINGTVDLGDGVTWRPFAPPVYHELVMIASREQPLGKAARALQGRIRARLERHSEAPAAAEAGDRPA